MPHRSQAIIRIAVLSLTALAACWSWRDRPLTAPASIAARSQGATSAALGASVTPLPEFIVRDSSGRALPNVTVRFVTTPGSTVTPTSVNSDANGVAKPSVWLVGPEGGNIALTASVAVPAMSSTVTVVVPPALPTQLTVPETDAAPSKTLPVNAGARFGHLAGRPFGIAYVRGHPGSILVSSLDVNDVEFVNASTFAVGRMVGASVTPSDVFVNRSGTKAYVSAVNGDEVTVVDVASQTKLPSFRVAGSARVLLSRDGSTLYVGRKGGLDVFSTATGAKKASLSLGTQVNGLAISRDGSVLYASEVFSGKVWRFATATMTATDSIATGGRAQDVVLHEPSGKVYVANESGWIDVLSASHVASVTRFNTTPDAFALGLTADGSKLYVSGSSSGNVYVLDRATGNVIRTVSVGGTPRRIAFRPDGRALVANEGGWIDVVR